MIFLGWLLVIFLAVLWIGHVIITIKEMYDAQFSRYEVSKELAMMLRTTVAFVTIGMLIINRNILRTLAKLR